MSFIMLKSWPQINKKSFIWHILRDYRLNVLEDVFEQHWHQNLLKTAGGLWAVYCLYLQVQAAEELFQIIYAIVLQLCYAYFLGNNY